MFTWYQLVWLFFLYSFLGWCAEVAFQAIAHGKIVNRGFLNGPLCPIYGMGVVGVLLLLLPFSEHILWLFLGGMLLTTLIELLGGWLLDRAFHLRWWDYRSEPYNFHGYICLRFSFIWGIAVVGVVKILQPLLQVFVDIIPHTVGVILLSVMGLYFIADLSVTLRSVIGLRKNLGEMERLAIRARAVSDGLTGVVSASALRADRNVKEMRRRADAQKEKTKEALQEKQRSLDEKIALAKQERQTKEIENRLRREEVKEKLAQRSAETRSELERQYEELERKIKQTVGSRRMLKAYPQLRARGKERTVLQELAWLRLEVLRAKENPKAEKEHDTSEKKDLH